MIEVVHNKDVERLRLTVLKHFEDGNFARKMGENPALDGFDSYEIKMMRLSLVNAGMLRLLNGKHNVAATYGLTRFGKNYLMEHEIGG